MRLLFTSIEWPFPDQPYRGPFAKSLADELSNYMEVVPLPLPVRRSPLNILKYRQHIQEVFHSHQCDHIHCYSLNTLLMVNPKNFPTSASAIGSDVFGHPNSKGRYSFKRQMPYLFLKSRLRHLTGIRCLSGNIQLKLMLDGIDRVPMKLLADGIDLKRFSVKSRAQACQNLGWDPNKVNVFFPGDPARKVKNFNLAKELVIHAENEVNPDFHTFPGVSPEKMNDYYRAADVVLITSFHEGSSNALKEALLCNTPVLSTPVGDAPYWYSFDVNGSLIDFDGTQEMFNNLLKYNVHIKRKQQPGINKAIAKALDMKLVASNFADFLQSLN